MLIWNPTLGKGGDGSIAAWFFDYSGQFLEETINLIISNEEGIGFDPFIFQPMHLEKFGTFFSRKCTYLQKLVLQNAH